MDRGGGGGGGSSEPYYYYFDGSPPATSTDHHHYYGQQEQPSPLGVTTTSSSSTTTTQAVPSRYESQKRRDWNTFGQYLRNQRPAVPLSQCTCNHVLDFMRYLDQFGKTKVHLQGCVFYGQPDPPSPCTCPLRQAWGSLDALIGRLRAAYEENGGAPENNPFASSAIRVYLREVRDCQAKARGIPYKKKKKPSASCSSSSSSSHRHGGGGGGGGSSSGGGGVDHHHNHHLGQSTSSSTMMHFS